MGCNSSQSQSLRIFFLSFHFSKNFKDFFEKKMNSFKIIAVAFAAVVVNANGTYAQQFGGYQYQSQNGGYQNSFGTAPNINGMGVGLDVSGGYGSPTMMSSFGFGGLDPSFGSMFGGGNTFQGQQERSFGGGYQQGQGQTHGTSGYHQGQGQMKGQGQEGGAEEEGGKIIRYISIHAAPDQPEDNESRVIRVPGAANKHVNIIFVKAPSSSASQKTEVILPEQDEHKNLVYVLIKKEDFAANLKIKKPEEKKPAKPQVFFIKYKDNVPQSQASQSPQGYSQSQQDLGSRSGQSQGFNPIGQSSPIRQTSQAYGVPA